MMSDLISRQAAIDALDDIESEVADGFGFQYEKWRKHFAELPSAQPEISCSEIPNSSDTISRQAAIDAMSESLKRVFPEHRQIAEKCLGVLPSAQPERTGHWVEIGDEPYDEWECDRCGFVIDGSGCIDPEEYRDIYIFCPHCGCRMLKEGEENEMPILENNKDEPWER